ncbi:MAG: hypothetical protein R3338_07385 [Thermoanaerobaculia bacterium]|nr:hypothetical protein [Thermoanaerobaculia bacterium]
MRMKIEYEGGTEELMIRIPVFSSDDAFGNEHATEEHSGQKTEPVVEEEELVGV